MRRLTKRTTLGRVLQILAVVAVVLFAFSGSTMFLFVVPVALVLSRITRRPESYEEYRDRYDQKYGVDPTDGEQE